MGASANADRAGHERSQSLLSPPTVTIPSAAFFGATCGALLALLAVYILFGTTVPMQSASDPFGHSGAHYVVGKERFDYFGSTNCWGGHTLDGRCISLVVSSGWKSTFTKAPGDGWPGARDSSGFPIASAEAKRKAKVCGGAVNPLYVEKYGHCSR